ncbi:MAG: PhzF family phenazine biosynthesis protein [Steroidobacteraceae bacterium]
MRAYNYRLLNVFALEGRPLSGNPLCVFEDARGLDTQTMQALALQFNLSETTFILPSDCATAQVRIFTPNFEMPFAGHPTLGTAQVVRELCGTGDALTLQMQAGVIPVTAQQNNWKLQANAPTWRPVTANALQLAAMLGLHSDEVQATPLWVNAGSEQLVVPLRDVSAVQRCEPKLALLKQHAGLTEQRFLVYVWAHRNAEEIEARFFFAKGSAVAEDPATGSACANLGGWFIANNTELPVSKRIMQGAAVGRPSVLNLYVGTPVPNLHDDTQSRIFVSGQVIELGRGLINL